MIYNVLIVLTFSLITLVAPPAALVLVLIWLVSRKAQQPRPVQKTVEPVKPTRQTPKLYVVK
jgi:hypothetical protein